MKNLILILFLVSSSLMFSQKKQKHGPFESFYKSGKLKTSGQYREGKKIGLWQDYYKSGKLQKKHTYSDNGKETGVQENYYKSGSLRNKTSKLKTEGFIEKGYYENGTLFYQMKLSRKPNDNFLQRNGVYHEFFENDSLKIEANYQENQLTGLWTRYYKTGEKEWEVNYYLDYKQGNYVKYFKNGQIELKGSTVLDLKHGLEKRFNPKGVLVLEGLYTKGKLDDKWMVFDEAGNKETIKYKDGSRKKSKSNVEINPTKIPFGGIEEVPVYPGCELSLSNLEKRKCMSQKIAKHVNKNFNTDIASKLGLKGRQRINIIFKINKQGLVTGIRARAPHKDLEKEAITVIKKIPKMIPGMQWGEAVNVPYSLPIIFMVNGKKKKEKDPFGDLFTN